MELTLRESDFQLFEKHKRRDSFYNEFRRHLRQKLGKLKKELEKHLPKPREVVGRTSLSHPYLHNRFNVSSMWVYFSRPPKERQLLIEVLGEEFGEDIRSHYCHTLLIHEISETGLEVSLRIHPQAWWDGENIKGKCVGLEQRQHFCELLRTLPEGFALNIHNWKKRYPTSSITPGALQNFFRYYTPGEHWFCLSVTLEKALALREDFSWPGWVISHFLPLLPVYRFIRWSQDNHHWQSIGRQ